MKLDQNILPIKIGKEQRQQPRYSGLLDPDPEEPKNAPAQQQKQNQQVDVNVVTAVVAHHAVVAGKQFCV
jgi:hypothetical protein